jgi:Protein of unknown function (DUF1186)/SEC-C motif
MLTWSRMTITEILKELEFYTGRFPKKAMRAAVEQREAVTPELLRVLESVAGDPEKFAERKDYMLHMFALFLLAQFRERRAYPLVTKIVSAPGETPFDLFGDTITEGLSRIFGSVYNGDPAPLQNLVENETANDYVRSAALDAFLVLKDSAQMPREEVVTYFRRLFGGKLAKKHSHAWNGLVCAAADLPAPELLEDIRRAYDDGLVDPGFAELEGIERNLLRHGQEHRGDYTVITDAMAEMEWWASFHPEDSVPRKQVGPESRIPASSSTSRQPVGRVKIGRNEPCPCGSGKKYKKCCGNN